jgi:hypothetical protein
MGETCSTNIWEMIVERHGKSHLGELRCEYVDNIKTDLIKMQCECAN